MPIAIMCHLNFHCNILFSFCDKHKRDRRYSVEHDLSDLFIPQGAAAQGVNHQYAKDIDVPVPNLFPGTRTVITTDEEVISPTYLQEVNFTNAYSGVSIRNVIMEERNVYCGTYNVMVLSMV